MKAEVLFINPGNHNKTYQNLSKEFSAIDTPVWTSLLAHFIRNKGYTTSIYDVNVDGWDESTAKRVLNDYNPDLIVMMVYGHQPSASTQTMPAASKIAKYIKSYNKDVPIAMGGTHPSSLPERTLREDAIDFVIQGEGAYTIEGLIKYIKGKADIKAIKGLWYKDREVIALTAPSSSVQNLEKELAGYAWDLLPDISNYRAHNWHCFQDFEKSAREDFSDIRSPYASLYTSLGCPYSCHFCCINTIFGKPGIKYWSLEKVVSWIDSLVNKYKVRNIRFADELFVLSPKRVEMLCDLLIEREYDLNIWAYGRVDTIDESLLKKLKKAGVNWLCLGIESANEKVRGSVNKKIKSDVRNVIKSIQANGINVMGNYMFGLPEDNLTTMEETLQLAMDLNCEFINFYTVMAYPGSQLHEWASAKEDYLPKSWEGFSQHSYETLPLPTNYVSAREVLRFRDEAFVRYFTNQGYLKYVRNKFGNKVENHIEKMLEIKLRRKLLEN
ncbi:MAG: radical protein [Candidatus Brocadiaceae bacterium]|nr:radical protein [Candidatus Brocadiaceae bacterium]